MVFTKLSTQEKDAFFGLLDEYFQSRPELFGQNGVGQSASGLAGTGVSPAAAASVVQRAFAANAIGGAWNKSNNPYGTSMTVPSTGNGNDAANVVDGSIGAHAQAVTSLGRVAAASLAFSGGGAPRLADPPTASQPSSVAPTLPRRVSSNVPVSSAMAHVGVPGAEVDKLIAKKTSVFGSAFKKAPEPRVAIPPAFSIPKNTFGPPPARRTTSGSETTSTSTSSAPQRQAVAAPAPPEEVAEGEWAEVLYDYSSEDPGDLAIEAGMRVFVTAKSSEDWWTGQVEDQGKEGLFPASYVKLL